MSAPKKQTAIQWLEKEFVKLESTIGIHGVMYELIEQAKAMEKEQIMDAFEQQVIQWAPEILEDGTLKVSNILKSAEQYYNETYETI